MWDKLTEKHEINQAKRDQNFKQTKAARDQMWEKFTNHLEDKKVERQQKKVERDQKKAERDQQKAERDQSFQESKADRDRLWNRLTDHLNTKRANRDQMIGEDLTLAGKYLEKNGNFLGSQILAGVSTEIGRSVLQGVDKQYLYEDPDAVKP